MSQAPHASAAPAAAPMTPVKALLVVVAIIVVVGIFLTLTHMAGLREPWAAFLFLLFWAGIEHAQFDKLAACVVGAIFGTVLGYLLKLLPVALGMGVGMSVFLGIVVVAVFCQVMGWLPLLINLVTMLFLTVTTIGAIQTQVDFADAALSLAAGIVYFAGLVWVAHLFQTRKSAA
jgi:hypothetical protein